MRSRHHHHYPFHALPLAAAIIGPWTSTKMAYRFQAGPVFERRVKTIFDPVRNSRARFHFPRLLRKDITGYTSSANQEDTSIGTSGSELTEPKSPKARRREEPQEERREERPFSDSLSAFSVARNSRRYEFLVRFSFSLKFIFWFCFSFCARSFFFGFFSVSFWCREPEGGEDWRFLSAVFCFGVIGLFLNEKRRFLAFRVWKKRGENLFVSLLNDSWKYWLFDSLYRQFWNLNMESFLQVFLLVVLGFHVSATIWCVALCFCEME